MLKRLAAASFLSALFGSALAGQAPPASGAPPPTIRTTTREVLLDVVVRNKHHHTVTDLRPEEVVVYEDGVRQKINVFRDVQGAEQLHTEQTLVQSGQPNAGVAQQPQTTTTMRQVNFVSIVFAQIAPLNLEFGRQAVLEFLKRNDLPNTYVTIYRLDRGLELLQPYTADKWALRNAVNAAAKGLHTSGDLGSSASVANGANISIQANTANTIASPLTGQASAQAAMNAALNPLPGIGTDPLWARNAAAQDVSVTLGTALLTQAHLQNGLRFADSLSTGMDAMESARQLVQSQEKLPGRKVILYLSDGLVLPMDHRDIMDSLISLANRIEVAFYAVDTRGLSLDDPTLQALSSQRQAGAESSANRISPRMGHMEDDDIQLSAASNKQLAMQELAESTGGFAVTNTNEIAAPMERVMEDIRSHYELAYSPTATNYDGHFRKIEVRISRPHVTVQTRKGYFAIPDLNGMPLQPFEMTALEAINVRPVPVTFPYETGLIRFRPGANAVEYEMAFDVPVSGLTVVSNRKTGKTRIRVSLVAVIHNTDGEVVGKVSRDLVREISKAEMPRLGKDHILYAEPVELPGGHYVIDTAVTDEQALKTTVKRLSVFVDSGKELGLSSLELVGKFEPLSGPRNFENPFETESGRVMPTLTDSVPQGKPVAVYFVVYPVNASEVDPKITAQLFRDGKEVARKLLALPQRQADGSLPMLLRLTPEAGQCDIVVTAEQGTLAAQSTLSVKVDSSPSGDVR